MNPAVSFSTALISTEVPSVTKSTQLTSDWMPNFTSHPQVWKLMVPGEHQQRFHLQMHSKLETGFIEEKTMIHSLYKKGHNTFKYVSST